MTPQYDKIDKYAIQPINQLISVFSGPLRFGMWLPSGRANSKLSFDVQKVPTKCPRKHSNQLITTFNLVLGMKKKSWKFLKPISEIYTKIDLGTLILLSSIFDIENLRWLCGIIYAYTWIVLFSKYNSILETISLKVLL